MDTAKTVRFAGRDWPVVLPGYAVRDELYRALIEASNDEGGPVIRVCAALIGLCTPYGAEHKFDYVKAKCNPLRYGGAVWDKLHEDGATEAEIDAAGSALFAALRTSRFPNADEVKTQADFSGPAGDGQTSRPSSSP